MNKPSKPIQRPIRLPGARKKGLATQFGALCYRIRNDKLQVLLVTSRGSGRWIVPKGWPIDGMTPAETASREAFEEAGAEGRVSESCLGIYTYTKTAREKQPEAPRPLVVALFPLKVRRLHAIFPEHKQRRRRWASRKKAASLVDNAELAHLILSFDPRKKH